MRITLQHFWLTRFCPTPAPGSPPRNSLLLICNAQSVRAVITGSLPIAESAQKGRAGCCQRGLYLFL